jgi:hypothetical protein
MTNPMTTRPIRLSPLACRLAVATAILAPVGVLAGAGSAAAAGSTEPSVPEGLTEITDLTGLLTINVPAEWTDTDLNPIDGEPSIWATTDMEQYKEGVGVPGVSFDVAVQQEADTEARLTAFMSGYGIDEGDCDVADGPGPQTTYEGTGHGALEGTRVLYDCGGSGVMGFVGIAADGTGVEVFLQLPEGEDPGIADQIMGTFTYGDLSTLATGTVPGGSGVPGSVATPPASTPAPVPAPASTVPAVPVPTVTPDPVPAPVTTVPVPAPSSVPATTVAGGSVAPGSLAGQVPLTEDTGRLTIQVPAEWTDTNMIPLGETPSIWASTDLTAFGDGLATSGVEFDVSTLVVDPTSYVISQIEFAGVDLTQCTEVAPVAPWTSPQTGTGVFTGAIVKYDCAGTLITSAVGVSADGTTELDILIKLAPGDDPAIADNILATFTLA